MPRFVPGLGENAGDSTFQVRVTKRDRGVRGEGFDERDAKLNFTEGDFNEVLEHLRKNALR